MRVLIFHGYLLGGTGSNVYNARLAQALVGLGHEVHLLSQERHPQTHPFADAAGDWDGGSLAVKAWREPVRCTVYRPNIGSLLPVYVADRYEGMKAQTFLQCTDEEIAAYVEANAKAVREVAERVMPDVALANHLVMGPVILARGLERAAGVLGREVRYAVKVHGSALEYTVKRDPERFLPYAREGLKDAKTVLVGSRHTAESLWTALGDPALKARTRLGPPGVDVKRFAPAEPEQGQLRLRELAERLWALAGARSESAADKADRKAASSGSGRQVEAPYDDASNDADASTSKDADVSTFARDEQAAAAAIERLAGGEGPLVAFVGKLIAAKGIDLLVAAWPLVLQRHPDARLAVVGFGEWREQVEGLCDALAAGDLHAALQIAQDNALHHLGAFLARLEGPTRERYVEVVQGLGERVIFTGRLDHEELADLLPACEALVVPSTFPEAFGMVAAEAAACGVLPVSARHSGLAEVSDALAAAIPAEATPWLSFPVDDRAVQAIAERLCGWLSAGPRLKAATRSGLVAVTRDRWSWEGVARGVIAAALGEPGGRAFG